jgi:pyrroline-5-carboxylate reductase
MVTIAIDNQDVVSQADWVFLCVKPDQVEAVVKPLVFRQDHKIINVIAGLTLETLQAWVGKVDLLVHAVPLSYVAKRYGPIVLYPDLPVARELLSQLGDVYSPNNLQEAKILQALTTTQASFIHCLLHWWIGLLLRGYLRVLRLPMY